MCFLLKYFKKMHFSVFLFVSVNCQLVARLQVRILNHFSGLESKELAQLTKTLPIGTG